jgi:TATA-binding protein-associated factor
MLFCVFKDLVEELLPEAFEGMFRCLKDGVDDVCAVAAAALIPVGEVLVERMPSEACAVVGVLWDSLADLDDLSSACNSIMGLLATLLAFPKARNDLRSVGFS